MGDDPLTAEPPGPPSLPIRTRRLVLRPATVDDAADMHAYYSDPEVCRRLVMPEFDREQVATMLRARVGSDNPWTLEVVLEHEGRVVGDLVLFVERPEGRTAEVGWVLDPAFGGRGLATEGTAALVRLAFDHYGVDLVHADPDTDNVASVALAGRLGMVPEGSVRDGRGVRLAVTARAWEEQGR